MKPTISYIVPAYNKEEYIQACLESILRNNIESEIIVINDGSKDQTLMKINEYARVYSNIKVIDQKNVGVSATRNKGLKIATGKYIQFVDADDLIDSEMSNILLNIAEEQKADVVCCSYRNLYGEKKEDVFCFEKNSSFEIKDVIENFQVLFNNRIFHNIGNKIYRREVIEELFFNQEIALYEDVSFCLKALINAKKSFYVDRPLYIYRREIGESLSQKYNSNLQECVEYYFNTLSQIKNRYGIKEEVFRINKIGVLRRLLVNEATQGIKFFKLSCLKMISSDCVLKIKEMDFKDNFENYLVYNLFFKKMWEVLYVYIIIREKMKILKQ